MLDSLAIKPGAASPPAGPGQRLVTCARLGPRLSARLCVVCSGRLTLHEEVRGEVCRHPRCWREFISREIARRARENAVALRLAAAARRKRTAKSLGIPENSIALAIVPAYSQPLAPQSPTRVEEFRGFLSGLIKEALLPGGDPIARDTTETQTAKQPDGRNVETAACAACRGFCCALGGTRAFLDVETIQNFMAERPGITAEETLASFMHELPRRSFQNSCVFHGETGCALPSRMRSTVCKNYYCGGLKEFRQAPRAPEATRVLIAASNGRRVKRAKVVALEGA